MSPVAASDVLRLPRSSRSFVLPFAQAGSPLPGTPQPSAKDPYGTGEVLCVDLRKDLRHCFPSQGSSWYLAWTCCLPAGFLVPCLCVCSVCDAGVSLWPARSLGAFSELPRPRGPDCRALYCSCEPLCTSELCVIVPSLSSQGSTCLEAAWSEQEKLTLPTCSTGSCWPRTPCPRSVSSFLPGLHPFSFCLYTSRAACDVLFS